MEVVLIRYIYRYDDVVEVVGVATNMDIAKKHAEDLKNKYPLCYGDNCGKFFFEAYTIIDE